MTTREQEHAYRAWLKAQANHRHRQRQQLLYLLAAPIQLKAQEMRREAQ